MKNKNYQNYLRLYQTGGSIVDYLKSKQQDYSLANRKKLAQEYGINNYKGTAEQNTQLLKLLKQNDAQIEKAMYGDSNVLNEVSVQGYGPEYIAQVKDYMKRLNAQAPEMRTQKGEKMSDKAASILKTYEQFLSPDEIAVFKQKWDLPMNVDEHASVATQNNDRAQQVMGYQFQQRAKAGLPVDYQSLEQYIPDWNEYGSEALRQKFMDYYKDELEYGKTRQEIAKQGHELQQLVDEEKQNDLINAIHNAQNKVAGATFSTALGVPTEVVWGTVKDITSGKPLQGNWLERRANNVLSGSPTYLTDVTGSTGSDVADYTLNILTDPLAWVSGAPHVTKQVTPAQYKLSTYTRPAREAFQRSYTYKTKPVLHGYTNVKGLSGVEYIEPGKTFTKTRNYKALPEKEITRKVKTTPESVKTSFNMSLPISTGGLKLKEYDTNTSQPSYIPRLELRYTPKTETIQVGNWGSPEFQEAFGTARKAGLPTFEFNGGTYTTNLGNPVQDVVVKTRPEGYPEGSTFIPVSNGILSNDNSIVIDPYWNKRTRYSSVPGTPIQSTSYLTDLKVKGKPDY